MAYSQEYIQELAEFVASPNIVDFQVINTDRFKAYAAERPYLKLGTELANNYVVVYTNEQYLPQILADFGGDFPTLYPKILSPVDIRANDSAGITRVLNQPFLDLTGRGVIIGIVDTGIDYTSKAFQYEDGSTKILSIWDQTLDGERESQIYFGSTYSQEQINAALQNPSPKNIVPTSDLNGHGTFIASVAASNTNDDYIGAAPGASLVCVKLRKARDFYIREYLLDPDNPDLYESTDCLLGIKYILDKAAEFNMPVVICIGLGSNSSAHDGNTLFENYISFVSQRPGYAFVTAAGNEGNAKHHTEIKLPVTGSVENIGIRVGNQGVSFKTLLFASGFDKISVGVTSPTGETLPSIPFRSGLAITQRLVLENTVIHLRYFRDISTSVFIGFENATQGIWEVLISGDIIINGTVHAWLPITGQVDPSVEFLKPDPEYTIVFPATAQRTMTCGAFNSNDGSLAASSSWGPTRQPRMAPDFVAPGVNIAGIYPTGPGTMTGTSVSAAVAAGAAALLMEWGINRGNMPTLNGDLIRNLLISGATRDQTLIYPNYRWGYGEINLYQTFNTLR